MAVERPQEPQRETVGRYGPPLWSYKGEMLSVEVAGWRYEKDLAAFYAAALTSIATSACCDKCQEAALVARSALDNGGDQ